MGASEFRFKRFAIGQQGAAMKVGTDGVLLGAWCSVTADMRRALDVGAGTGLIALMVAQRSEAEAMPVDAVEIDPGSFAQATENILRSPWCDRVAAFGSSLQEFAASCRVAYDLIVSNPPYFNDSLPAPDLSRNRARHTTDLSYEDLISNSAKLLSSRGLFSVILPAGNRDVFVSMAEKYGLYINRSTDVLPKTNSTPKRSLLEFSPIKQDAVPRSSIIVESGLRHEYSPEYIALTRDFYLKF